MQITRKDFQNALGNNPSIFLGVTKKDITNMSFLDFEYNPMQERIPSNHNNYIAFYSHDDLGNHTSRLDFMPNAEYYMQEYADFKIYIVHEKTLLESYGFPTEEYHKYLAYAVRK